MRSVNVFSNSTILSSNLKSLLDYQKYDLQFYNHTYEIVNHIRSLRGNIAVVDENYIASNTRLLVELLANHDLVVYVDYSLDYGKLMNVINNYRFLLLKKDKINSIAEVIDYFYKAKEHIDKLEGKLNNLEDSILENKTIYKAKLVLMKQNKLSEEEAYKYIIREAMSNNTTKLKIAKSILERVKK